MEFGGDLVTHSASSQTAGICATLPYRVPTVGIHNFSRGTRDMTGQELRDIRQHWGMSQSAFARVLGYSVKGVANLENERQPISDSLEKHVLAEHRLRQVKKIIDSC